MKNLIQFLIRYHFTILFILIEIFALSIVFQNNNFQKAKVVTLIQNIKGIYHSRIFSVTEYLGLREINETLSAENTRLNNILQRAYRSDDIFFYKQDDPEYRQQYYMTGAKVLNNKINTQHNFLTLNKGSEQGIKPGMAVISSDGVVGVIYDVSQHYATVISLLNTRLNVSAKFKKNDYFGALQWDGKSYQKAILNEIPHHVEINIGDSIITSGYSTIFPEGIQIGTVQDFHVRGGNFYEITVDLSTNFKKLRFVNVISNLKKKDQLDLENSFPDD